MAGQGSSPVVLGSLSMRTPDTIGDVYLTKDYRITSFWLYEDDKAAGGFASKLDLQRNEFDILMGAGAGVKVLPGSKVKSVTMIDSVMRIPQYFVNGQEYKNEDGVPYVGFFQILSEGKLTLLKLTKVVLIRADQSLSHNTGRTDNRFIKKTTLYVAQGVVADEAPGRKGILKLMESHKEDVNKFAKVNEIDFGNEHQLTALFDYYNSLVSKP